MHGMNNIQSTSKCMTAVTNRDLLIRDTSYVPLYKLSFKICCFDPADYSRIIPHCIHLKQMFMFERGECFFEWNYYLFCAWYCEFSCVLLGVLTHNPL